MATPEYPQIRIEMDDHTAETGVQLEVRVNEYGISVNFQDLSDVISTYLSTLSSVGVVSSVKNEITSTTL